MRRDQIAINSVSTTQASLEEGLAAYAGAGFRNIEFVLPLAKNWLAQGHTVAELRQMLSQHGLSCIGGFETAVVCFGTAEERKANREIQLGNARLIDELGGGTLVVGTDGPGLGEGGGYEALDVIARELESLVRGLEGLRVNLAIEFNWSPVVKSLLGAVYIAEKVNHPQFGILFDPAHYHTTSTKFEHLTEQNVRWIKHFHFNDMRNKPGDLSDCNADRVLPGAGILELGAMIAVMESYGYKGYYSIEMFNKDLWQLPAAEAARYCYESMIPYCS